MAKQRAGLWWPAPVDDDAVEASLGDGVLTVMLPKLRSSGPPHRVPVRGKGA